MWKSLLGRLIELSADLGFTAILSIFFFCLLLFSSATLRARWTEGNQNRPHALEWVQFDNVCPKSEAQAYLPLKIEVQKSTFFSTTSQLRPNGNLNSLYNRASALESTMGLLQFTNGFKLDHHFTHPPLILHSTSLLGFAARPKTFTFLRFFRRLRDLMANII